MINYFQLRPLAVKSRLPQCRSSENVYPAVPLPIHPPYFSLYPPTSVPYNPRAHLATALRDPLFNLVMEVEPHLVEAVDRHPLLSLVSACFWVICKSNPVAHFLQTF